MPLDLKTIRREFPLLENKTYLNSCSYGVLSRTVERAFMQYMESRHERGAQWDVWVGQMETLRSALGRLLSCNANDVSISTSLSESVNSLASSLDFGNGRDTVVVTDFDFPTTSQIWLAQERRNARVVRARADESGVHLPFEQFERLIDDRTLLVSVPYVCYRNGVKTAIEPIIELAHSRGAMVLVDGYQAIGAVPLNAPQTGADFIAGGCLKYLMGTAGAAFMYVRNSQEGGVAPTMTGWFAQADIGAMDIYHHRPAPNARRFASGTPNVSATYACAAGIGLLLDVGLEAVHTQIQHLTKLIADGAATRGWRLVTPPAPERHGAMMAIASTDAPALVSALAGEGIVTSDRDGNLRVSPHFYNNDDDIEALFRGLDRHAKLVQRA